MSANSRINAQICGFSYQTDMTFGWEQRLRGWVYALHDKGQVKVGAVLSATINGTSNTVRSEVPAKSDRKEYVTPEWKRRIGTLNE